VLSVSKNFDKQWKKDFPGNPFPQKDLFIYSLLLKKAQLMVFGDRTGNERLLAVGLNYPRGHPFDGLHEIYHGPSLGKTIETQHRKHHREQNSHH